MAISTYQSKPEKCRFCSPSGGAVFTVDVGLAIKACNCCGAEKRQFRRISKEIKAREELLARLISDAP